MTAGAVAAILVVLSACQAPHDNPLDPDSPGYIAPAPPDPVEDLSADSISATGCRLSWTAPANAFEYRLYSGAADWTGDELAQADLYDGELPGVKPAGQPQSAWIAIPPAQTRSWVLFSESYEGLTSEGSNVVVIEAPPRDRHAVSAVTARSSHIAWWGLPDQVSLDVSAAIADSDGVDSVWVVQDTLFIASLLSLGDGLRWSREVMDSALPSGSVESLVGHPLSLYHHDMAGFSCLDTTFTIVRVIEDFPQTYAPAADSLITQDQDLVLEWLSYNAFFNFTYAVEIIHMSESYVPTKVYEDSLISSETYTHEVTAELTTDPSFFLWTVTVVDEFGNRARSREAKFRIIDGE